jgi:DNA-binding NarL/FixJ family response regulator
MILRAHVWARSKRGEGPKVGTAGYDCMGKHTTVRILVADDDARVCWAVQTLLQQEPEPIKVRECSDVGSLVDQLGDFKPDLVLLDWELPGRLIAASPPEWHAIEPIPRVIILSTRPESEQAAMGAGADAFVSKGDPPERLLEAIRDQLRVRGSGEVVD